MKYQKSPRNHALKKRTKKTTLPKKKIDRKKLPEGMHNGHSKGSTTVKTYNLLKLGPRIFLAIAIIAFIISFNLLLIRTFPVAKRATLAATDTRQPVEIMIKDVGIDIPVYPAKITQGTFDTTTQGASYLTSSPLPGYAGNSIMYAHNWTNLFGNLYNIKKGEKVEVILSDKSYKTFTVASTQTVHANQVSILNKTTDKRLTLFTCTNFLDADRFVVTAIADRN